MDRFSRHKLVCKQRSINLYFSDLEIHQYENRKIHQYENRKIFENLEFLKMFVMQAQFCKILKLKCLTICFVTTSIQLTIAILSSFIIFLLSLYLLLILFGDDEHPIFSNWMKKGEIFFSLFTLHKTKHCNIYFLPRS